MATITSAGSGLWSAGATWVGGVTPADNDAVVIASGQVVEFDVDQSGFATGIDGITITGTLSLTRTSGTYYLKIKAAKTIGGAGTFDCGTSGSPIPFAAKHTITGGSGWYIKGNDGAGMTMTVYAAEPVTKYVKTTAAESAGATVLEVDTDVTGDVWSDGDLIRICGIPCTETNETRTIAAGGIAAGSITITTGLTAVKSIGTYIYLESRNLKIIAVGGHPVRSHNKLTIGGGEFVGANGYTILDGCGGPATISGGVFRGGTTVTSQCSLVINDGVFVDNVHALNLSLGIVVNYAHIVGNSGSGVINCTALVIHDCLMVKNSRHIDSCPGVFVGGGTFISSTSYCFQQCVGAMIAGGTYTGNYVWAWGGYMFVNNITVSSYQTYNILSVQGRFYNCLFTGSTEHANYHEIGQFTYTESFDHDQIPGAFRAWTSGGITSSQAITVPTGYTTAMRTVLERSTRYGYWQREVTVGAGASVNIRSYLRKTASMTYLPRVIVFNKATTDPFAGGAGIHTFTMTNSVDTWEDELYTYTNGTAADVTLVIRTQGMNASGSVYSVVDVEQINVDLTAALAKLDALISGVDDTQALVLAS